MSHIERRSYERGNFSFEIKFKTVTLDEYEGLVKSNGPISTYFQKESGVDLADKIKNNSTTIDPSLVNYFVLIDERLDLILELLEKGNKNIGSVQSGAGNEYQRHRNECYGRSFIQRFIFQKYPLFLWTYLVKLSIKQRWKNVAKTYNLLE